MLRAGAKFSTKLFKSAGVKPELRRLAQGLSGTNFEILRLDSTKSAFYHTNSEFKVKSLNSTSKRYFASLPPHTKLTMPALSPTMSKGKIVKWHKKVGDSVDAGEVLADIETDKATLGFDMQDSGFVAQILVSEGTNDIDVGQLVAILVEDEADVKAFADFKADSDSSDPSEASGPKAGVKVVSEKDSKGCDGPRATMRVLDVDQGKAHGKAHAKTEEKGAHKTHRKAHDSKITFRHGVRDKSHATSHGHGKDKAHTTATKTKKAAKPAAKKLDLPPHTKLTMPALSPTMKDGKIAQWNKKEGDQLIAGDVLADVETDKATVGFEMQDDGYLARILVQGSGEAIVVGQLVAIVVDDKADLEKFKQYSNEDLIASLSGQAAEEVDEEEPEIEVVELSKHDDKSSSSQRKSTPSASGERVVASPLAKKIAAEKNIPLDQIHGSGPNGRILRHDVESYKPKAEQPKSTTVSATSGAKGGLEYNQTTPSGNAYVDRPVSSMRKVIAERLLMSKSTIPHYYLTSKIQMDDLMKARGDMNEGGSVKISFNDLIIKAASLACRDVPEVNSWWNGESIRTFKDVDISVAVDIGDGLITPIIRSANKKGLMEISSQMKELAQKAKSKKLRPEEYQGGSFSISNLGMLGITEFAAVINPPQAAILAVGSTEKRMIPDDKGGLKVGHVMTVTLSCDHRVVDGAVGAKWLAAFKKYMEKPAVMLL